MLVCTFIVVAIYACTYVHKYYKVQTFVSYVCMHECMYVRMQVCMCVCMYA